MKPTKEFMNKIIEGLDKIAQDYCSSEYGLPTTDLGQMALMREALTELFDEEEKKNSYNKRELQ